MTKFITRINIYRSLFLFAITFWLTVLIGKSQPNQFNSENLKTSSKSKKLELILGYNLLYSTGNFPKKDNPRRAMSGYSIGFGFIQFLSNRLQLSTRLLYEAKGYKTVYSNVDTLGNSSKVINIQKLNYFSLFVMPSFGLGKHQRSKLIAAAYLSLLSQDVYKQEIFLNGNLSTSFSTKNVKGRFDNYDYGISIGVNHTQIVNNDLNIGLQLLTNFGLNNIVSNKFIGATIKPCNLNLSIVLTH